MTWVNPFSPSSYTRARTRVYDEAFQTDELIMDTLELPAPLLPRRIAYESGRNTPKDLLFKSPPRRVFASAPDARSSRLRARVNSAACVPLSDLHGVGLPAALGQMLGGPMPPIINPFQSFAPSFASTDFRPIARLARPHSGLSNGLTRSNSNDLYASLETRSGRSLSFPSWCVPAIEPHSPPYLDRKLARASHQRSLVKRTHVRIFGEHALSPYACRTPAYRAASQSPP